MGDPAPAKEKKTTSSSNTGNTATTGNAGRQQTNPARPVPRQGGSQFAAEIKEMMEAHQENQMALMKTFAKTVIKAIQPQQQVSSGGSSTDTPSEGGTDA